MKVRFRLLVIGLLLGIAAVISGCEGDSDSTSIYDFAEYPIDVYRYDPAANSVSSVSIMWPGGVTENDYLTEAQANARIVTESSSSSGGGGGGGSTPPPDPPDDGDESPF